MSKLIKLIHPYEIENVNTLNDFFIVLKNLLRLSSKRILEKKDGILIPVRWSGKKNCWVVDRGTDLYRDIVGIDLDNIDKYFNVKEPIYQAIKFALKTMHDSKLDELFENFNLKKNENKFFAFEYCNNITNIIVNDSECMYPIGLFQRCQTKKRSGRYSKSHRSIVIDNSKETLEKVSSLNDKLKTTKVHQIKNYIALFNKFYKQTIKKNYCLDTADSNITINIENILFEKLCKHTQQKDTLSFISNQSTLDSFKFNKIKINVILYLVYFDFFNFIKNILNLDNKKLEGFVVIDDQNNIYYKITGDFILKVFKKNNKFNNKNLLPPILPGTF
jgi:hypothetical protein